MANISVRRYIRWIPAPASEPTSTIVLTSPGRHFVDVRTLLGLGAAGARLDWAFAGTSSSHPAQDPGARRATWRHWVDSSTAEAESVVDEALVRDVGDAAGTELEAGRMVNPATGEEADYEEAWVSVEPMASGAGPLDRPACAVLRTCDDERQERGMIVLVGQFCQGILRVGEAVTAERWEWRPERGWALSERFGQDTLPIEALVGGKETLAVGSLIEDGVRAWTVIEAE